jgi:chorismate mutase/prephenate dehydratase
MDKLKGFERELDAIDREMVALLEKRMAVVERAAEYKWNYGVHTRKESKEERVVDRATELACGIDLVAYAEGLLEYMEDIALRYEKKVMARLDRRKREG